MSRGSQSVREKLRGKMADAAEQARELVTGLNGAVSIAGWHVAVGAVLFSYAAQDASERDRDGIWRRRWFWWAWDRETP